MNVWIDNSTYFGWERRVIDYFQEKGIWKKVVYNMECDKFIPARGIEDKLNRLTTSVNSGDRIYEELLYKYLYTFIDMYSRNSSIGLPYYDTKNIHEYLNLFNLSVHYYYDIFRENSIDVFILLRSPHIGVDFLKCMIAKEMGIRTLILEQSLFPNRFFYYWDFYDYGTFETSFPIFEGEKVPIENKFEKDLFYMKSPQKSIKQKVKANFPSVTYLRHLLKPKCTKDAIYNYLLYKEFEKNSKDIICKDINFSEKYVYFALHLQPEKTTSSWGGIYNDQLLALERLSALIPDDWWIYVKENPKQGHFMRGKWFYKRLSIIPKVKVVPNETNTYKLLSNCQFASTITGTVGWEAITGGKNVLVFGWGVWYKTFPGVFTYSPDVDVQRLVSNKIDHAEIENKLAELKKKMGVGVIYRGYDKVVDSFSKEENVRNIIDSLEKILSDF